MTPVEELVERARIHDLLIAYCRNLDRMDLDALGALFAPDCVVTYGTHPDLVAEGRTALVASLARMWRWQRTAHHLCNVWVRFDGRDTARAESGVHAWHEAADGRDAEIFGTYIDLLTKRDGNWLVQTRRMEMRGARGAFRVPVPPAERQPPPPGWIPPEGLD